MLGIFKHCACSMLYKGVVYKVSLFIDLWPVALRNRHWRMTLAKVDLPTIYYRLYDWNFNIHYINNIGPRQKSHDSDIFDVMFHYRSNCDIAI